MSGRKPCHECDRKLPSATKMCECGFAFMSSKKCYSCGKRVPIARKKCDCGHSFKQAVKKGFKEMPVILTSDRLRPRRSIRMKCELYDDNEFIYNVSMSTLPRRGRFSNGKIYDDMYDKDLNDAALESIANSIVMTNSKSKEKLDKMYPKRERKEPSSNNVCQNSHKKEKQCVSKDIVTATTSLSQDDIKDEDSMTRKNSQGVQNSVIASSHCQVDISPLKKPKISCVQISSSSQNGLKDLIRGEVSKAIKKKMLCGSNADGSSTPYNDDDSIKGIKEEAVSDSEFDGETTEEEKLSNISESSETTCEGEESNSGVLTIKKRVTSSGICSSDVEAGKEINCSINDFLHLKTKSLSESNSLSEPNSISEPESILEQKSVLKQIEEPIRKKMGRPRKHPLRPKGPVGRPRKHLCVEKKYITADAKDKNNDNLNDSSKININMNSNKTSTPTIKRGRPKGCKDTKPRKARHDYIERLIQRKVDVDSALSARKCMKSLKTQQNRPSLMASAKTKDKHGDKQRDNGALNSEEIERIEKRLDKTNPFIIPDGKKELYSLILDEINRRISSQSFQSTL